MSQTRRLAAILAADVIGYSRLIGADEGGTLAIREELVDAQVDRLYRQIGQLKVENDFGAGRLYL